MIRSVWPVGVLSLCAFPFVCSSDVSLAWPFPFFGGVRTPFCYLPFSLRATFVQPRHADYPKPGIICTNTSSVACTSWDTVDAKIKNDRPSAVMLEGKWFKRSGLQTNADCELPALRKAVQRALARDLLRLHTCMFVYLYTRGNSSCSTVRKCSGRYTLSDSLCKRRWTGLYSRWQAGW